MASSTNGSSIAISVDTPEVNLASAPNPTNVNLRASTTIYSFLKEALSSPTNTGEIPATLFSPTSNGNQDNESHISQMAWPPLETKSRNNILLYPGSFNPPHQGHLATILYFHERRKELRITAMFVYTDPVSVVEGRKKKWADVILPVNFRYELFFHVPEISKLVASGWLQFIVGDMHTHIKVLRDMTVMISEAGFDVKLIGVLGGDKLTVESEPHLAPGSLEEWGPVDEFLIINARRPVDFFDPKTDQAPKNLPGCTKWIRGLEIGNNLRIPEVTVTAPSSSTSVSQDDTSECSTAPSEKRKHKMQEISEELGHVTSITGWMKEVAEASKTNVGVLWVCQALTVSGKPTIQFRASQHSASNGVSSTNVRQVMAEAPDDELLEGLKDKVISVEVLVRWLKLQRNQKREVIDGTVTP